MYITPFIMHNIQCLEQIYHGCVKNAVINQILFLCLESMTYSRSYIHKNQSTFINRILFTG
jgi:hypothetical protein